MNAPMLVAMGYALGSLPTGYVMGRLLRGVDIRTVGSGNVGATNVFRSVGRAAGVATLLIDMWKGYIAVFLAQRAGVGESLLLSVGLAAVVGHSLSVWVRFRGGKGVATAGGVFLALMPGPTAVALGVFAVMFALFRRVSVGSLTAALVLPLAAKVAGASSSRLGVAGAVAVWVFYRHLPNIRRLIRGEEPPLILGKKP